jgi:serine/threonine protein kinase
LPAIGLLPLNGNGIVLSKSFWAERERGYHIVLAAVAWVREVWLSMSDGPAQDVEVFSAALELSLAERGPYLDRACEGDSELRKRVEALLRRHDELGEFPEKPPPEGVKLDDRIGRYKLLKQLGEGGCGVVYLAEQEEPIHRQVALKIIKPGMDSRSVITRFEVERQALALMDHPHIAKVFDAGATESGRPYFVMELVAGVKITDYCDQNALPTRARLELFVQVCDAIQHAHQKGIIHRDIKPSNIIVTAGSGEKPVSKVIDFGIAKATTGQMLTDKTTFTAVEMLIGTPAYMSPEQAALTGMDADTRTDIYSLGVLLYELLTGTTPFDTRELLKAGFDEVRRVIRDEEPVRPSRRFSTMVASNSSIASLRDRAEAPKLIRQLRGDLDWIVMKALEKDPTRRYATANGLAMEIQRYLSGEPVLARPPSRLYKAQKLIARNKLLSGSLAIIFILLAAGLAVTARLLVVEKRVRERAQHQEEVYRLEALGLKYTVQNNYGEAEKSYHQSFAIRRQFLQGQPPDVLIAKRYLDARTKQNKYDESDGLLAEFPKSQLLALPGYTNLFGEHGNDIAPTGRWKEAADDLRDYLKANPNSPEGYHILASLLVACADVSEYRRVCQQIISRFSGTQNLNVADTVAKDCLILPSSGADLKAVGALADLTVTRGTNNPSYPLFQCCKALAEYRQEHFAEAIQWAESATTNSFPYAKAEGYAILSMAQFKSARTNEALNALADCTGVIDQMLPKLSSGNLGDDWRDWIIAHALQSEAKRMIEGEAAHGARPWNVP